MSIFFQREDVITENYDFIASFFMHFFQVMDSLILRWIVEKKSFLQSTFISTSIIFPEKIFSHLTPNFDALNPGKKTSIYKIYPVCLIKFWANQVM